MLTFLVFDNSVAHSQSHFEQDFDFFWETFNNEYAYFDEKLTNWDQVKTIYKPQITSAQTSTDFINILEYVLEELYDDHIALTTHTPVSPHIVPARTDIWAEWIKGKAIITAIRPGFPADSVSLRPGMEILRFNGMPIKEAVHKRIGKSFTRIDRSIENWTLRKILAGHRNQTRTIEIKRYSEINVVSISPELFDHAYDEQYQTKLDYRVLDTRIGYLAINTSLDDELVADFDASLKELSDTEGLIIDLRKVGGGHTGGIEGIIGRLIDRERVYQKTVPRNGDPYLSRVYPRGDWHFNRPIANWLNHFVSQILPTFNWHYKQPIVILVNPWTGSAGEGVAISLEVLGRATVVGTKMAGLDGSVYTMQMPHTEIGFQISKQKVFNGTLQGDLPTSEFIGSSRKEYTPSVLIDLSAEEYNDSKDPILKKGLEVLMMLL